MTDDNYKDMVISHDKHIDTLANSIESLASSVGKTNAKLDNVIDVITAQNVLVERLNNLDTNVAESFKRAWSRLGALEDMSSGVGCGTANNVKRDIEVITDKLKVSNSRLKITEEDIKSIETASVSGNLVRWVLGLLLFYSIAFGTYVVTALHSNETSLATYIAYDDLRGQTTTKRLDSIIEIMNRKSNHTYTMSESLPGPRIESSATMVDR